MIALLTPENDSDEILTQILMFRFCCTPACTKTSSGKDGEPISGHY
jgi:hypothetical protein